MPSPFKMIWDGCRNQRPEFLAVAGMFQVSQLMHDHILESGYGKPHQGHVESDRPGSVIARTPSGTHSAISDQGWLRHPHDRHPRVEQWPGNAFYFTASEHGDGSFSGHFTRPRNYEPMAGNPGTSPASSPVLHVHLPHNLTLPPSSSRSASRAVSRSCSRFRSTQGRCSRMNRLIRPDGTPSGAETTTFPPGGMIRRRIFFIRFQVTDTARSSTWIRQSSTIYETHFCYQDS